MDKKVLLLILTALISAVFVSKNAGKTSAFDEWKSTYGANWGAQEESYRRLVFEANVAQIQKHNADKTQTYTVGINQFTAMTKEEFVQTYLTAKPAKLNLGMIDVTPTLNYGDVDWVAKGGVTSVKNQGSCGSCWAFSAVAVMESWAKLKGQNVNLSQQQLVDCSTSQGNQGCNGGWPVQALNYVKANGIASQSQYPYKAVNQKCQANGGSFKIGSIVQVKGCDGLGNAIQSRPVSVTVDASNWSPYRSGVFSNCGTGINHAVLLVGVAGNVWKIKNSWGAGWGQSGFIRLAAGNTCGVCINNSPYVN